VTASHNPFTKDLQVKSRPISIEDVPLNGFHQLLSVRSGGGWVMDGYVLSIIGVALVQLTDALHLDGFWQGMVAASALIGIFVGGFLGGWLTDQLGRKRLYFVPPIIFTVCSIAQFWVQSGEVAFLLRFMIGIAVGIEYPVAGSLLVEFMPRKHRGPRLAMLTILWFAGAALAYIVGNLILSSAAPDAWRYVLASPAVIGIALFIVRLGTPESPRSSAAPRCCNSYIRTSCSRRRSARPPSAWAPRCRASARRSGPGSFPSLSNATASASRCMPPRR